MVDSRISISNIVQNQVPDFVKEDNQLLVDFLKQYYIAIENEGSVLDILQNIDKYIKVDSITNLVESTETTSEISFIDETINVVSTEGFPNSYGLLQIDSEIITYKEKTETSFIGCVRGFSGVTSYNNQNNPDSLVFKSSESAEHLSESTVTNLSILFLKEFLFKVKSQITPGFEGRKFYEGLNERLFIKQSKDFYSSKGTDESFKILFRVLFGEEVEVIKPSDNLFIPSDAQYRVTKDLVVQSISGNPFDLLNKTLFQDQTDLTSKSYGSVNNVRKIQTENSEYYILSLDFGYNKDIDVSGSIFGEFSIHPSTKNITEISIGSTVIDVDSTVGFGTTGSLVCKLSNGTDVNIQYQSKSYNQFYECSGIDQVIPRGSDLRYDSYAYGYAGRGSNDIIKVRVTGVLSDLEILDLASLHKNNESITVKSLGLLASNVKSNNWLFNISSSYDVRSSTLINSSNFTYRITTYDENNILIGDSIRIILTDGTERIGIVYSISSSDRKSFEIKGQGQLDINKILRVEKNINKGNSTNYPEISIYNTNISNVYLDSNEESNSNVYVSSSSIPTYLDQKLNIKDRSVRFSGTFNGTDILINSHGFYTGDSVTYRSKGEANKLNILDGIYFVYKVDNNTIRLARSRSNIDSNNFIFLSGTVFDNTLEYTEFAYQRITSQKLVRKISNPKNTNIPVESSPGCVGILANGVEILNYKSKNSIFYGEIENIDVLSGGDSYDIINPPTLIISDSQGSGAEGYCEVEGILSRVDVIDGGFDYVDPPIITFTGGNGFGAEVEPNMVRFFHEVAFNANQFADLVDLSNNTIAFSTFHKFRDAERIIYRTEGQDSISGLSTDSSYYASVQDEYTIKLHRSYLDAISGINTVEISSYSSGVQKFESYNLKSKIGSIIVKNGGQGYMNRKISISSSGINTSNNTIYAKNHRYETGEIITYTPTLNPIGGLSSSKSYFVTKIDDDNFKLSSIGVGSTSKDFYYKRGEFLNFDSTGSGNHEFNYEPIKISITGNIGVSSLSNQDFSAKLQPVFRGEIKSVYLSNSGVSYGSSEIINYNKQPLFTLDSGSGAEVIPVISNGSIQEVLVVNSGSGYNSIPNLVISSQIRNTDDNAGTSAALTPIIDENGSLVDVKVINGGIGYKNGDSISVESAGAGAKLYSNPKKWNINIVERLLQTGLITDDDGVIYEGLNENYGLQYTHAYAPRKLRQILLASKFENGNIVYQPDLIIRNNVEVASDGHSPIIGWAYDGNPIYGPYGYDTPTGGSIRSMVSGYEIVLNPNRPSYPEGFFVNDYIFTGNGDLDEHNGRFCITPEYPNGVYAYFTTINSGPVETFGSFVRYKSPIFPYFVGNSYKSSPNSFNFDRYSNQDYINPEFEGWIRNTTPYGLNKLKSSYEYLLQPNKIKTQKSLIRNVKNSGISSIGIVDGGDLYKVNDVLIFDNSTSLGPLAFANISKVGGKNVTSITVEKNKINNVEFTTGSRSSTFVGYSTQPHELNNLDIISISGLSTNSIFKQNQFYTIGVSTNTLRLSEDVPESSVTGLVTYFSVTGNLSEIKSDDIYEINSEKIKILGVELDSLRLRVLRQYENTVGQSHTTSNFLYEDQRKFTFSSSGISTGYNFKLNKVLYFNPNESVGLGTISGVGIGTTIYFSNPGLGKTQLFIPTRSIYLPKHELSTGDSIVYSSNGGNSVSISTDGINSYNLLDDEKLYVAKLSEDLIGIATEKVGVGTNGSFVSINSDSNADILYFTGIGTGEYHSFKTNYSVLSGDVNKNVVTVSTSSTHGLFVNDTVEINVTSGITTNIIVKYNDTLRKMIINPIDFSSVDINLIDNTITIPNHGFKTGQKVIHTSNSPSGGLQTNVEYYVIAFDEDKIKLSSTYFGSLQNPPYEIDITSQSDGTLGLVNPFLNLYKNQTVKFDLSDSSLSYFEFGNSYPAFNFGLYTDKNFKNEFISTKNDKLFEVFKNGSIGIDQDAYLELKINNYVPTTLYYNLSPVENIDLPESKLKITSDFEYISNNNEINIIESLYNGTHRISGISTFSFNYNLTSSPEQDSYSNFESLVRYQTTSQNAYGPISEISVLNSGKYSDLPGISSVFSEFGSGSILDVYTKNIGNINNVEIIDIGFDYPSDKTLKPIANIAQILKIDPLSSLDRIGISSAGVNYIVSPNLVLIDNSTNKVDNNAILEYQLGDREVTIIQNTNGINNVEPTILPINNSNGIGISSISYDSISGDVTIKFDVGFSTTSAFPFSIGDKILVENIKIGINSTGKGFNSEDYNYQLFTLNSIDPNIGGIGATIGYNLSEYLIDSEFPGLFDPLRSAGRVIPEKHFPIFDVSLKKTDFFVGERVISKTKSGLLEHYNIENNYICVSSDDDFEIGELIQGLSSYAQGIIIENNKTSAEYKVDSSSIVKNGWNLNRGFLDDVTQRIHDNDYYQYFSYSIKSKVEYEDWKDSVSSLNHTAGFKKFSDLIVEQENNLNISSNQNEGDFIGLSDIESVVDLECVNDFDIATETTFGVGSNVISNQIILNSKELQDYFESVNNRVLLIDDISSSFNNLPRSTRYSIVDTFRLSDARYRKFFAYVRDKRFIAERQISVISLLQDNSLSYISNYGLVYSQYEMGSFDFNIFGNEGNLLFYPTKYSINDFDVSTISYNIKDSTVGIGTTSFGDLIFVNTFQETIPSGLSTSYPIVSIANTYLGSKILLEISDDSNYYEVDEITLIHDGSEASFSEYGQLTTNFGSYSSAGIGTYSLTIDGSNINVNVHPYNTLTNNYTVNSLAISAAAGVGSFTSSSIDLNTIEVGSAYTSIISSAIPTENIILSVNSVDESQKHFDGVYAIAFVEDTTNNQNQISEIIILSDGSNAFISEYGNIETGSSLGVFSVDLVGNNLEIYFTPIPNTDINVKIYYNNIGKTDPGAGQNVIDLNNALIDTGYGTYSGTERDIRRDFRLTHRGNEIFRRVFDSFSVDIENNLISLPNHFFTTGEEISYSLGSFDSSPIGIATTVIPGIGSTDILPSTLYVVKNDDLSIKVAASASESLRIIPNTLNLTYTGIGTDHIFSAKNQNKKVLISIDNMIQSPVVGSSITSSLLSDFSFNDNIAYFTGITSFFGGDLIKIGDEIMKIESVGFGSDSAVLVQRPWMGTGISSHVSNSIITKVSGNYNIVDNTLNFYEAPYGELPIGSITNPPSERDFIGITTHSTFSGRVFLRSGISGSDKDPYETNYIFDDISSDFNGITTQFTLKSDGSDVTGISTNNAIILIKDIFQEPQRTGLININGDCTLFEDSGSTILGFTGYASSSPYDPNNSTIPVGGQIISVGSTFGFGYQPLVSAGGTAIVSISGTIQSISIGNSGSGYRSGIQNVNVGVLTESLSNYDIEFIGIASVIDGNVIGVSITNPGFGYTHSSPPIVVFDSPLSYSNIPLIYSTSSPSGGIGTEATIDIVVGQGSSVIDFEIKNIGYAYGQGDILTVDIGGIAGIPTDTSKPFAEFQVSVEKTYTMEFSGWSIGDLQLLDKIDTEFDGEKVRFALRIDGIRYSIVARRGSNLDIQSNLIVFLNDILQVPGESYIFNGGSTIEFTEPPKVGDTCKILFYKGTGDIDVSNVDVLETIKIGDTLQLNDKNILFQENERVATSIESVDIIQTNPYEKPGVNRNETYERPLKWCRQRNDKVINGQYVGKDRVIYEPLINPTSYIIQPISISDTEIYVDNIFTFFNSAKENALPSYQNKIRIISQDSKVGCSATAIVSNTGSIDSIIISNNGNGYSNTPIVSISEPIYANGVYNYSQGKIESIPYSEFGSGSMSLLYSGDFDNEFFEIDLPFEIEFLGESYRKLYLGSNGYITFGSGSTISDSLGFNRPALKKIHLYAGNRRVTKLYTQNLVTSYRIRVEGYDFGSSPTLSAHVYEIEINPFGYVDLNYVNMPQVVSGGIGDGINQFITTWQTTDNTSFRLYTSNSSFVVPNKATATAYVSSGIVTDISITNPGSGYSFNPPPTVLIEEPSGLYEDIENVTYEGDFGIISGISTTTVGVASTGIVFDFHIPLNSFLRDPNIVGTAITISGISTGDYFIIKESNIGFGLTSLYSSGLILGIGTQYLDNVYEVASVSIAQTDVVGYGNTYIAKVTVSVSDYNGLSGIGYSEFFGEYSWGKVIASNRTDPKTFDWYNEGTIGITTSPILKRINSLKYSNYNS